MQTTLSMLNLLYSRNDICWRGEKSSSRKKPKRADTSRGAVLDFLSRRPHRGHEKNTGANLISQRPSAAAGGHLGAIGHSNVKFSFAEIPDFEQISDFHVEAMRIS